MKTVKIAFNQGKEPMFFGSIEDGGDTIKTLHLLTLVDFSVKNGSISWVVQTEGGSLISGGSMAVKIPETCISITPSVPLVMHKRSTGLAPEFIFKVPNKVKVYPLNSVKKKYPNSFGDTYSIFRRNL